MILVGQILGLVVLGLEIWAARSLYKRAKAHGSAIAVVTTSVSLFATGLMSAYAAAHIAYPSGRPDQRLIGFPFLAGAFEKYDGVWLDYVGPLTAPASLIDLFVGFAFPALCLATYLRVRRAAV